MTRKTNNIIYITGLLLIFFLGGMVPTQGAKKEDQIHLPRYYVQRATEYEENNQWDAAKREIDEGLQLYPDYPELRYLNGRYYYYAQEDLQQARYNLIKALQENDEHYRARRLLVDIEEDDNHISSAICYINELLEFEPYDKDLWRRKIALYDKLGHTVEATEALERLGRIYPTDSVVQNALIMRNRELWNQMVRRNTTSEAAVKLERFIEADPLNLDYYFQLINLYRQLGENERALGTVNMGLAYFPYNPELVRLGANVLSGLGEYVRALNFLRENRVTGPLYNSVLAEVAADDRLRDPYEANGRLYARTGDREALSYLLNTSLTRGYYEDAKHYINESIKLYGVSSELLVKEYELEKRFGTEAAQLRILQQLYALNPDNEEFADQYADMMLTLASKDMENRQWVDAEAHLQRAIDVMGPDNELWPGAISQQITLLGNMGRLNDARRLYEYASRQMPSEKKRFESAYEDVAASELKVLIDNNMYEQALEQAQSLLGLIPTSETALRTCINMSQTLDRKNLFYQYAARGYEQYPDNPYFVIKQAIALQEQGRMAEALGLLQQRPDGDFYLNSQLSAAYQGVALDWADDMLKHKMPDIAMEIIDDGLRLNPGNKELLYAKGRAYEQLKDFEKAYELQSVNYNPSNAEQGDWYQHMKYLRFRSFKNRMSASYLYAAYDTRSEALGSVAHMYSIANLTYDRILPRNIYTLSVNYKGIDGYIQDNYWDSGGMGFEVIGQWTHQFNSHWSLMLGASWANQYFNKFGAKAGLSWYIRNGWEVGGRAEYRRTPPSMFFFAGDQTIVTESQEYNLLIGSPWVSKTWDRVVMSFTGDLIYMRRNIFYNTTLKASININEDRTSQVGIFGSYGTFPQLQFFDLSTLSTSARSNISLGFITQFLLTKNLILGVNGSWNTFYNPQIIDSGRVLSMYRNIYILSGFIQVAF